ncbi:nuclease-related domain-containing protein [Streptomyces sp. NBC_00120]|uniref:nuclease-related domain-containing protein n=1 Tax=Streptomyces sp. NBC_00120 TaxID=2975660 RepID=UPI002250B1B5|nr:nuclease-related domain-containing protein [Streptomyces sp. NBC_00120]MCX5326333.1 NERD domain-containing protein [Streptomyces sp. NBC_00120]
MSSGTILLAAAVLAWLVWGRRPGSAGRSAAAHARQLRTPLVRLAELAGVQTVRGRQAAQFAAGAEGERRTGRLLGVLRLFGWTVLHDLALPTGRANVDHLVVSFWGVVIVVDSKRWDARYRVRAVGGRLLHGDRDVTDRLRGLRHEAETVSRVLGVPVFSLVVMHDAPVDGGALIFDGIRIVPAQSAVAVLRGIARRHCGHGHGLGRRARLALKPYGRN